MSEQSNKDLLKTIGKSFTQIATNFWVNRKNTLLNRLKQAALYAFHMFIFAWFFVGILYPIAASNPDTILLADKGVKAAINITSSFWGALVDIGTIMAGAGTVGLLWFGWIKADDWIHSKRVDIATIALQKIEELRYEVMPNINRIIENEEKCKGSTKASEADSTIDMLNKIKSQLKILKGIKVLNSQLETQRLDIQRACSVLIVCIRERESYDDTGRTWNQWISKKQSDFILIYGGGVTCPESFFDKCIDSLPY